MSWKPNGFEATFQDTGVEVDVFGKCRKKALLVWRSVLERLEKQLLVKKIPKLKRQRTNIYFYPSYQMAIKSIRKYQSS